MRANKLLCPSNQVGLHVSVTPHSHDLGKHVSFERMAASPRICYFGGSTHSRNILDAFILHHFSNSTKKHLTILCSVVKDLTNKGTKDITAISDRTRNTSKISSSHIRRIRTQSPAPT